MFKAISRIGAIAVMLLLGSSQARAVPEVRPGSWFGAITYNTALPLASSADFAGNFSPRGFGVDVRYMFMRHLSAGLAFGWQGFDEKTDEVVSLDNAAVQGTQLRYINAAPMLVNVNYYVTQLSRHIVPFVGFGLGTYYIERRVDVGIYSIYDDAWHFGIAPEAGIGFRLLGAMPVFMVRYNHAFSSGGSGDQAFLSFNFGVALL